MKLNEVINSVLDGMFEVYLMSNGINRCNISDAIKSMDEDCNMVYNVLKDRGLVKGGVVNRQGITAGISVFGIMHLKPDYFLEQSDKLIMTIILAEDHRVDLMAELEFPKEKLQLARDILEYMQIKGFADGRFNQKTAIIKLSPRGREYYDDNEGKFLD